jgi:hypothetical protein
MRAAPYIFTPNARANPTVRHERRLFLQRPAMRSVAHPRLILLHVQHDAVASKLLQDHDPDWFGRVCYLCSDGNLEYLEEVISREPGNEAPIELKARSVPLNDGVGKHDDERLLPVGPNLAGGDPEQFVEAGQLRPWMPTLKDCELLSQGEIF